MRDEGSGKLKKRSKPPSDGRDGWRKKRTTFPSFQPVMPKRTAVELKQCSIILERTFDH